MQLDIKEFAIQDKDFYIACAKEFYSLPAVAHPVPEENFHATFDECIANSPYAKGFIFYVDGEKAGYGLISLTFSAEVGGICVFVEEAFVLPEHQSKGMAAYFFDVIEQEYILKKGAKRMRLEVTKINTRAIDLYSRMGFEKLTYSQMVKDFV